MVLVRGLPVEVPLPEQSAEVYIVGSNVAVLPEIVTTYAIEAPEYATQVFPATYVADRNLVQPLSEYSLARTYLTDPSARLRRRLLVSKTFTSPNPGTLFVLGLAPSVATARTDPSAATRHTTTMNAKNIVNVKHEQAKS